MKELWEGNRAIAEAAVRAGLQAFFGYPITPQTELLEYLARRMPELGRVFVQAESELGAINMVYGAACAGARTMSSSSGPGFSLMQEGLSYIAGSEVPCVIVNVMRGGPGLGNIAGAQSDYSQMTKGGGHGDYHPIVLAPASVQEAVDLIYLAFDLADQYRTIVLLAADGTLGQMMEPVELPPMRSLEPRDRGWEVTGCEGRARRIISSIHLQPEELEAWNQHLQARDAVIREKEVRWEERYVEGADLIVTGFGTVARIAHAAVKEARAHGRRVGWFRPITLYPFPYARLAELGRQTKKFLVVEMNAGQMLEDVRLALGPQADIRFYGRLGGVVPMPEEVLTQIESLLGSPPPGGNGHGPDSSTISIPKVLEPRSGKA